MWHRFPQPMRNVVLLGLKEASRQRRASAEPEDFLNAMTQVPECSGAYILKRLGVVLQPQDEHPTSAESLAAATVQLFEQSYEEAALLHDRVVGSDHLLLALLKLHPNASLFNQVGYRDAIREVRRLRRLGIGVDEPVRPINPAGAVVQRLTTAIGKVAKLYKMYARLSIMHPKVVTDPYPIYDKLRARGRVRRDPLLPAWVVTGYAEVVQVFRDQRFSSVPRSSRTKSGTMETDLLPAGQVRRELCVIANVLTRMMVFSDAPVHMRLRSQMGQLFSPRNVANLRTRVQEIADELIDDVAQAGNMDFARDYACPLPLFIVSDILGFRRSDWRKLKEWSDVFGTMLSFQTSIREDLHARRAMIEMRQYFDGIVAELQARPNQTLLSELVNARDDEGPSMNLDELFGNCVFMLAAGHETTAAVLGSGLRALLDNPDQLRQLRDDPSLIPGAVEELLRFESPVQWTSRRATEDVELGGQKIPKNAMVMVSMGAANRDPQQFPDPHRLDIRRGNAGKNLAFSGGSHYCLGASLARIELQVGLSTLLRRLHNIRIEQEFEVKWRKGHTLRAFDSLPITFEIVPEVVATVAMEPAFQPNSS